MFGCVSVAPQPRLLPNLLCISLGDKGGRASPSPSSPLSLSLPRSVGHASAAGALSRAHGTRGGGACSGAAELDERTRRRVERAV
eukprot:scaffold147110_cov18-Tisochrysis_lutea.AAC.1